MPFLPYPGMRAFFACLFHLPVVLALMDLFMLGLRMPNFMVFSFFPSSSSGADHHGRFCM